MTTETRSDIARAMYRAYAAKDRAAAERLIADDFRFTSPLDNGLDRAGFFAICWPGSATAASFEIAHIAEAGDRVFVTYDGRRTNGKAFRNTEVLTIRAGRIAAVEVYFGWNVPHDVPAGRHEDAG